MKAVSSSSIDGTRSLGTMMWFPVVLIALAACTAYQAAGFYGAQSMLLLVSGQCMIGALTMRFLGREPTLRKMGQALSFFFQTIVIGAAAMILTYSAATVGRPLADPHLLAVDRALGYDWRSYALFFVRHPWLGSVITTAYNTNILQPVVLIVLLVRAGRVRRLEYYVLANVLAVAVTAMVFSAFPATTAWTLDWHTADQLRAYKYLMAPSDGWVNELLNIRAGRRYFPDGFTQGLVGFPSFHAQTALLNIWLVWQSPRLRMVILPLNICMLAATPLAGGHYLSDLIGGAIVAGCSLGLARRAWLHLMQIQRKDPVLLTDRLKASGAVRRFGRQRQFGAAAELRSPDSAAAV